MTDETKSPAELLLNACVYAPIGLALEARNLLPTLAERGRNHVNLARVVGQFALGKLGKELGPLQSEAERWLAPILASLGLTAPDLVDVAEPPHPGAEKPEEPVVDAPAVEDLPLPGYDALAASQVVPRLKGMNLVELANVAAYERANRGRRTILNRVDQLLSSN